MMVSRPLTILVLLAALLCASVPTGAAQTLPAGQQTPLPPSAMPDLPFPGDLAGMLLAPAGAPNPAPLAGVDAQTPTAGQVAIDAVSASARKVVAGLFHTCALTIDGDVKCWGDNRYNQLGDGTWQSRSAPANVFGLSGSVVDLAAGNLFTCAVTKAGGIKCWGYNPWGQLGDGSRGWSPLPVDVISLAGKAQKVTAGSSHACALLDDGAVQCWGYGYYGQLGDGSSGSYSTTPVSVRGLASRAVAIDAGHDHSCAVTDLGSVQCWGSNGQGQLGNGSTPNSAAPVGVSGLTGRATGVTAGESHTCAIVGSGAAAHLECWGSNGTGQLGDGTTVSRATPVTVSGLQSVTDASAGMARTCAITSTAGIARLFCWGDNSEGQLGDGTAAPRSTPGPVPGLFGVATVAAGFYHACATTVDGRLACWGSNLYGQLGMAPADDTSIPGAVGLTRPAVQLTVGSQHSCALLDSGIAQCWGSNASGQLGDGTRVGRGQPVDVKGLAGVQAVSAAEMHSCALLAGRVACWGDNRLGELGDGSAYTMSTSPVYATGLTSPSAVSAGYLYTCALDGAGEDGAGMKCWGNNYYGQLGDGTRYGSRTVPVQVIGLESGVKAISAGYTHVCALTMSGGAKCWGSNLTGELGDGGSADRQQPVDVVGLSSGVLAVVAGEWRTCALMSDGGVKCWGSGPLGDGGWNASNTPVDVTGLEGRAVAVAVGWSYACAVNDAGRTWCWGYNTYGQLGTGSKANSALPVEITSRVGRVSAIAAARPFNSGEHTCAIRTDGSVACWGANESGQLGTSPGWLPTWVPGFESSGPPPVEEPPDLPSPTTTTLASWPNPAKCHEPVTFKVTVNSPLGLPQGRVSLIVDGDQVAPITLEHGSGAFTTASLGEGMHEVIARYTGSDAYERGESRVLEQVVACGPGLPPNGDPAAKFQTYLPLIR